MKFLRTVAIATAALIAAACTTQSGGVKSTKLQDDKEKLGYAIGHQIGSDFKKRGIEVDFDSLVYGVSEGMTGVNSKITQEEAEKLFRNLQTQMMEKAKKESEEKGKANAETGKKFLEENKAKEGVVTLPSGLQYKVLTEGKGPKPSASDMVTVHYKGTLTNGEEFDSSYSRGEPASFPVGGVIKGWTEALQLMPVGSKWQVVIPSDLAYGANGAGPKIGPNSVLVFEVELISIGAPKPEAKDEPKKEEKKGEQKKNEPKKEEPKKEEKK